MPHYKDAEDKQNLTKKWFYAFGFGLALFAGISGIELLKWWWMGIEPDIAMSAVLAFIATYSYAIGWSDAHD